MERLRISGPSTFNKTLQIIGAILIFVGQGFVVVGLIRQTWLES